MKKEKVLVERPPIVWKGKKQQVATVCGHRIGFIEQFQPPSSFWRVESRYIKDWVPNEKNEKKARKLVEKHFYKWWDKAFEARTHDYDTKDSK